MTKELKGSNFPNLRFPEFTEEWKVMKLKEICKMQAGKFVNASEINDNYDINLFPCFGGNGLRGFTTSFNNNGIYSLIGRQGALCGNVTLVKGKFYATEHAVVVYPNIEIDQIWLFYLLIYLNLNQYSTGMAQPGLSVQNLYKVESVIPKNVYEQQKVSSFLTLIDNRISTQKKIIENLKSLKNSVVRKLFDEKLKFKNRTGNFPSWEKKTLAEISKEHLHKNPNNIYSEVFSVSKHKGVINQIEHLGRSFSAKDITNYKLVYPGDLVYTKSPTSEFPFGIIKQNKTGRIGVVSPLYCVFTPKTYALGYLLHEYFNSHVNTFNYLNPLVQKGAKNTMNINNDTFLNGAKISLPTNEIEQNKIYSFLSLIEDKINGEKNLLNQYETQKKYLLINLFI